MIDRALERAAQRAQAAEISLSTRHSVTSEYEDDRLKNVTVAQTTDLGVRVIADGKLGAAHGTDPARAEDIASRAIELAEFGSDAKFQFPGPSDHPAVKTFDPAVEVIPKEIIERDYGCGDPSKHLRPGETVLDLGSGGGKICYIASQVVGAEGKVIGIDMNMRCSRWPTGIRKKSAIASVTTT